MKQAILSEFFGLYECVCGKTFGLSHELFEHQNSCEVYRKVVRRKR